jgi:hypothetical protein
MTNEQVAKKFIDFDWSDDVTEEQKQMIYDMDNISIEIKKGKKMSVKIFNEEHQLWLNTIKGIEELKDLLSTIISKNALL